MSRVIIFSRYFPSYHPRKGDPTFFIEKIWKELKTGNHRDGEYSVWTKYPRLMKDGHWQLPHLWRDQMCDEKFSPKYHTIRAGNRWKVGDKFSPRAWSGLPYRSKQIQFAPVIEIKKIFKFEMDLNGVYSIDGKYLDQDKYEILARNDGLTEEDMFYWFMPNYDKPKEFTGQILCWNESILY